MHIRAIRMSVISSSAPILYFVINVDVWNESDVLYFESSASKRLDKDGWLSSRPAVMRSVRTNNMVRDESLL